MKNRNQLSNQMLNKMSMKNINKNNIMIVDKRYHFILMVSEMLIIIYHYDFNSKYFKLYKTQKH